MPNIAHKFRKKKRGSTLVKVGVLVAAALLFWYRYHYCHHPVLNPMEQPPTQPSQTEPIDK